TGGALLIPEESIRLDVMQLSALVRDWQASHWLSVPSFYRVILDEGMADLRSLETVIMAGEACPGELVTCHRQALPATGLFNEYGPTEATVWSSVHRYSRAREGESLPIGRPIANTRMFLLDAQFCPVPMGVVGEICIAGGGVAQGYHARPALSAEKFVPDPFSSGAGERLFRTGDMARYAPDGVIEFVGRRDQQVKVRGHRIELGEIETALRKHPLVRDAVVVPANKRGRTRLAAFVVDRQPVGAGELKEFLRHKLPDFMIPASFVVLRELPRNAHGKVDRARLPDPDTDLDPKVSDFLKRLEQLPEADARAMLSKVRSSGLAAAVQAPK
ncbi:amino acid adenylation domain-containing protein, partial [Bradyrhizobium sp.]|uniref:amino acid adenylation domain-containing protein n=1 Tax=Bradyrhizobium sp. TaxID=376 RepID=UPI003C284A59